ncbi:hypothetical protein Nepgr_022412 [Nepenthes gracilis]|uniref:Uncharacterized protein n=1 Tax=Nepenthes gracilis TaxID=150966 RepID=A0AAD3T2I0_NEPGR|nr:hypothetical protein Nepgr_022412 [Nepenthes gracilis]
MMHNGQRKLKKEEGGGGRYYLLMKKNNIGVQNCNSRTPLHIAAKQRNEETMKYLIKSGAFLSPEIDDSRFNPPLHYCSGLEWAYGVQASAAAAR